MTTTDPSGPTTSPWRPSPERKLRRSRTQRVGAGVSGGLGEYFGLDPVLFRVLFATAAFFGGAGILAYLLAWAAIPEEGTERAVVDNWIRELRRRRVPFWVVAVLAGLFLWVIAFSWWAPGPFFPVLAVVVLLAVAVTRSSARSGPTVSLIKSDSAPADDTRPEWLRETRSWIDESRRASRERRRRALPVKLATLVLLGGTLLVLGLVDAASGVSIPSYFWATLGIVTLGLVVGLVLRRTPWSITALILPALAGVIAFGGSHARFHDGVGDREYTPTTSLASHYRLGLGKIVLDLRALTASDGPREVRVDLGAGQVQILAAKSLNLTVLTDVHIGAVTVDGADPDGGFNHNATVGPATGATGEPITVHVYLTDGLVQVDRS